MQSSNWAIHRHRVRRSRQKGWLTESLNLPCGGEKKHSASQGHAIRCQLRCHTFRRFKNVLRCTQVRHLQLSWSWRMLRSAAALSSKNTHWQWQKKLPQASFKAGLTTIRSPSKTRLDQKQNEPFKLFQLVKQSQIDCDKFFRYDMVCKTLPRNNAQYGIHVFQGSAFCCIMDVWISSSVERKKGQKWHGEDHKSKDWTHGSVEACSNGNGASQLWKVIHLGVCFSKNPGTCNQNNSSDWILT